MTAFNAFRYEPLRVGNMWVVTRLFTDRHPGFVQKGWAERYWDKDRGLWLLPDVKLTKKRRELLQGALKQEP